MAVAHRHDGVGQYGFGQHYPGMAPPSSFNNFGYDRRPKLEESAEPMWPVPRMQQPHQPQNQQGHADDRARDVGAFPNGFSQPDFARQQGQHQPNYTYDGSSSVLRNPVVYSQPAQVPWGMGGQPSTTDYAEYPTASFIAPMAQRAQLPMHGHSSYLGGANGAYGESSLASGSDVYPKVMGAPSSSATGGPYDHTPETLWPLGPNSLDAFAGIPPPSGPVTRLTLTSADKGKLKSRSSLPPPKQFKCSACDAIFSRNHDLKRHARIHLAVKPFPCGYCDKAFSRKDALKRHVLVKGCGIGNKKSGDVRKRAATLAKLEHSEGGNPNRAPYDGAPLDTRGRDFSSFRDDTSETHQQQQQQQQQHQPQQQGGFQGDASSSRSFPGRLDAAWPSTLSDPANASGHPTADYTTSRMGTNDERAQASHGLQMPQQGGAMPPYGSQPQQQVQPYPSFSLGGSEDAFQQSQRPQLAGGLVNAFTSPEGTSSSSPIDAPHKHAISGGNLTAPGEGLDVKMESKPTSRPGSAKLMHSVPYGAPPFPGVGGGVDNGAMNAAGLGSEAGSGFGGAFEGGEAKPRFGPASYPLAPMMSPSLGGPSDQDMGNAHPLRRQPQQQQQQFGSYFGNNAAN
ncbi:conserved hypothetical protein [Sporisorium reilianum SRZ2]|uniref:C2H2-type domain-containing protein n=1 Tax=Sporisorium reilianum (strain SRZ2) TaxID=999809 RepID=E6ZRH6_SPORE|nr:conserved hypothetical protein [Sporisorium reilianum SRZ2]